MIVILCYTLFSCNHKTKSENDLVNESLKISGMKSKKKIIFYRDSNNYNIKNSSNYIFLTGEQLLNGLDENFYILKIRNDKNMIFISFFSYKTGEYKIVKFDNKHNIFDIEKGISKPTPSKSFYIYYEIMKRKYPNYMNWENFPIPKDSLK